MSKVITKQQILKLVENKCFNSEKELEEYIIPCLVKLFKIKSDQIDRQSITTSFDYALSNCADIVIRTGDNFERAMIVIELKLSRSIEKYKDGEYEESVKQLSKYCQDVRAPYGILLTDINCHVFENKFFLKDHIYKRINGDNLPTVNKIEKKMAFNSFMEFIFCKHSWKYAVLIIFFYLLLYFCFTFFSKVFGAFVSFLMITLISLLIISLIALIFNSKKVLE